MTLGKVDMDRDVSVVFSGPISFCSLNKTFKLDFSLLIGLTVVVYLWPYPVDYVIFVFFCVSIRNILDYNFALCTQTLL